MATLQDIQDAVTAEATVEQSVVTLLGGLEAQLKQALAENDPVAMQAVVDQIHANAATLSAAVAANTPASPPAATLSGAGAGASTVSGTVSGA